MYDMIVLLGFLNMRRDIIQLLARWEKFDMA
jgi:hypothetical protein